MFGKLLKGKLNIKKKKNKKGDKKDTSNKPSTSSSSKSASKQAVQSTTKGTNPSTSTYDESIIQQLTKFGYERTEIISAMNTVTDKNDINVIQAAIDASTDKASITEMKYNEPPKKRKDIGIANISKQCKMVYDSGTYQGYPWSNVFTPDTSYWCSKDTTNAWVVFDTGKQSKIYVLVLQYASGYNATSINIKCADAFDAEDSEWKLIKKVDTKDAEKRHAVGFGKNPKHKQFIKIEFAGNSTYIGITACELYGQLGSADKGAAIGAAKVRIAYKDISAGIPCVANSKTYDGYPISNMYTAGSDYWCSADANNVYLIFDTGTTKISQWEMKMGYSCGKVTLLTSDSKTGNDWTKITSGSPESLLNLGKKNKRFIKLAFSEPSSGYVGVTSLKIKIPQSDKSPEGMEDDEKKEEVQLGGNSKDISKSLFITCVGDSGTYSGYDIKQAYVDDDSYWCSSGSGDQFVVFDVNVCSVDVLEVLQSSSYTTKNISAWTSATYEDDAGTNWTKVASCTVTSGAKGSLKINGNNKRYVKLLLEQTSSYGSLQRIKWFGSIQGDTDITDKLTILKTSSAKTGNEVENIFKDSDNSYWSPKGTSNEFITVDCNGKEIEKIYVAFSSEKKCKAISIILAEISNDYAFKEIIKTFKFNDKSKMMEELDIKSLNAYANGYKQFVQLKFAQPFSSDIGIEQVKFLGKQTTDKTFEEEEKVGTIIDNEAETTARGKVVCVENSGTYAGESYALDNMYLDNANYWCSSTSTDIFMIFDCTEYAVNKIAIKVNQSYKCLYCAIFTSEKHAGPRGASWKEIGSITEMDEGIGVKSCRFKGKAKQFIKIEFYDIMNSYLGIDRMRFIGKGLDEEYNLTLEEVMNSRGDTGDVDDELVSKYLKTITKQRNQNLTAGYAQLAEIEADKDQGPLSKPWMDKKRQMLLMPYTFIYNQQIAESLLMRTTYEQEEAAKVARSALKKGETETQPKLEQEVEQWKPIIEKRGNMLELESAYLVAFKNQNIKAGETKRAKYLEIEKDYAYQLTYYGSGASASGASANADAIKAAQEQMDAYSSNTMDKRNDVIFGAWCASIDGDGMELDANYSVQQYMEVVQWAHRHKPYETEERVKKLANLLDEALKTKEQSMHKFHLFQLSDMYEWARPKGTQIKLDKDPNAKKTIWLLFDCGARPIHKIKIKLNASYESNKIDIYSSNEYDEKYEVDDDEAKRFSKFELLKSFVPPKSNSSQELDIAISNANKRYLRIEFNDLKNEGYVGVERIRFYVQSDDANEVDEDTLAADSDPNAPKLTVVSNAATYAGTGYRVSLIYEYNNASYWCTADSKAMWIVFDAQTYSIEHAVVKFASGYGTKSVTVSTSNDGASNWSTLSTKHSLSGGDNKIGICGANKKYIKLEFSGASGGYLGIQELKWKLVQKKEKKKTKMMVKNMTCACVSIMDSTPSYAGGSYDVDNVLKANDSYWMNVDLTASDTVDEEPKHYISRKICDEVCRALNIMRSGEAIDDVYKSFIKFLLCWQNESYYIEMLMTAKKVMNLLKKPLDIEYERLKSNGSRILELRLDEADRLRNVSTNLELLCDVYSAWYEHKKALFWPSDLLPISNKWKEELRFEFDEEFRAIRRDDVYCADKQRSLCTSDDLAMEFLNCIAIKLDPSFQAKMQQLFAKNRQNLKMTAQVDDEDIGVHQGPVKTKSRQNIKIKLDYSDAPHPQCMAVLDIVRCAVVCEDDKELCHLYDMIVKQFSGQIKRVKNAFHPVDGRSTFGYRAVLINIAYGDAKVLPYPKYRMICEVQLLLNKYFKVRGKMHLGYGIVRSEGEKATKSDEKAPHYVLAQDSCKFGKLDI